LLFKAYFKYDYYFFINFELIAIYIWINNLYNISDIKYTHLNVSLNKLIKN